MHNHVHYKIHNPKNLPIVPFVTALKAVEVDWDGNNDVLVTLEVCDEEA